MEVVTITTLKYLVLMSSEVMMRWSGGCGEGNVDRALEYCSEVGLSWVEWKLS